MSISEKFIKLNINIQNIFEDFEQKTLFDQITIGRIGSISVDTKNGTIPIIRSTTNYNTPTQYFSKLHYHIIEEIKKEMNRVYQINNLEFNNAMNEIYNSQYYKMGFHSDQSIDLADNSYICIFSCYENPNKNTNVRKIIVQKKDDKTDCAEIILENNSVVIFSTDTNEQYIHKIVMDYDIKNENRWLGITFRLSKTFIHFIDDIPYFCDRNVQLKLATDDERKQFMRNKHTENSKICKDDAIIDYTLSIGDLLRLV